MSGQSNATGLLRKFWNSTRRLIRRHAIPILIRYGRDDSPALITIEILYGWGFGGQFIHDEFYMHQVPLSYLAVFRQASLEPGPSGLDLRTLPTGQPRPLKIMVKNYPSELFTVLYVKFKNTIKKNFFNCQFKTRKIVLNV